MAAFGSIRRWSLVCSLIAVVPACSGGSGGGGPGPLTAGLPPDTTPTASLMASQANASALELEVQDGALQMAKLSNALNNSADIPSSTPGGIEETEQCSQLGAGGSGSITISTNADNGTPAAGTEFEVDYNSCTITSGTVSETINGSVRYQYTRFNSASDFAVVLAENVTVTVNGSSETVDFSETLDLSNGTETVSYNASNGGSLVVSASDVTTSGNDVTISNATYTYQSSAAGGVVKAVFDHWEYDSSTGHAIGGTVTVTGANGAMAVITASPTGYTVDYTSASGTNSTFTVTY